MKRQQLTVTDLEGAVLGVLASDEWQTTYSVARTFADSPSEFWSGSAGAIYPLIVRLEKRKWVIGRSCSTGRRKATQYRLSSMGHAAFEHWLFDVERAAGMGFDPLRTRLLFLRSMSVAKRARFLRAVADRTKAMLHSDKVLSAPEEASINRSWLTLRIAWIRRMAAKRE